MRRLSTLTLSAPRSRFLDPGQAPAAEGLALPFCAECGRSPQGGEAWRVLFADIGEAVTYCPECAEREFGERDEGSRTSEPSYQPS